MAVSDINAEGAAYAVGKISSALTQFFFVYVVSRKAHSRLCVNGDEFYITVFKAGRGSEHLPTIIDEAQEQNFIVTNKYATIRIEEPA